MEDNKSRYTLRIDQELLDKLGYIAEYEGRTKNGLDTTTDAILSSQKKLSSNIGKGSTATLDTLREQLEICHY